MGGLGPQYTKVNSRGKMVRGKSSEHERERVVLLTKDKGGNQSTWETCEMVTGLLGGEKCDVEGDADLA